LTEPAQASPLHGAAAGASAMPTPRPDGADLERRFGGLRRLYGPSAYAALRTLRVAVVGLGGVGSWAAEALARSGVARLVLIDLDHVAESNINRQVQALGATLGMAKAQALAQRLADIHPGCELLPVEAFAEPDTWPALLPAPVDVVIDACDQAQAKLHLASWSLAIGVPVVVVGAAGGKRRPQAVEVDDLSAATHDPLLAALRQRLRRQAAVPRQGGMGLRCVFSREPVVAPVVATVEAPVGAPAVACAAADGQALAGEQPGFQAGLHCHGYGSSVTVTASFGMAAAAEALRLGMALRVEAGVEAGLGAGIESGVEARIDKTARRQNAVL